MMCLADLKVTLSGFIQKPAVSVYLPANDRSLTLPMVFDVPGGKLIE